MRNFKRTIAVLLCALLLASLFTVAASAEDGKLKVTFKSSVFDTKTATYNLSKDKTFTAAFNVKSANKLINAQGFFTYDSDYISVSSCKVEKLGSAQVNTNPKNKIYFNATDISKTADFSKGADLLVATFNIVKAGETEISLDMEVLCADKDGKDVDIISEGKVLDTSAALKGTLSAPYSPSKAKKANPMTVKVSKKTIKAKALKKKAQTFKAITVKNAKGKVSYAKVKNKTTKKYLKKISVNSKTGKIKFKKGAYKKGTVKVAVKITAKGNSSYKLKTVTKVVKVKIK